VKKSLIALSTLLVAAGTLWMTAEPAGAINNFKKEFEAKYVRADSTEPNDVALREAVAAARCYVCHVKGESRKARNVYGTALSELLDKIEDKDNVEKIRAALDTVAGKKSNPNNGDSPTFGELISSGKLPAGADEAE
jgi:hypothetical protein